MDEKQKNELLRLRLKKKLATISVFSMMVITAFSNVLGSMGSPNTAGYPNAANTVVTAHAAESDYYEGMGIIKNRNLTKFRITTFAKLGAKWLKGESNWWGSYKAKDLKKSLDYGCRDSIKIYWDDTDREFIAALEAKYDELLTEEKAAEEAKEAKQAEEKADQEAKEAAEKADYEAKHPFHKYAAEKTADSGTAIKVGTGLDYEKVDYEKIVAGRDYYKPEGESKSYLITDVIPGSAYCIKLSDYPEVRDVSLSCALVANGIIYDHGEASGLVSVKVENGKIVGNAENGYEYFFHSREEAETYLAEHKDELYKACETRKANQHNKHTEEAIKNQASADAYNAEHNDNVASYPKDFWDWIDHLGENIWDECILYEKGSDYTMSDSLAGLNYDSVAFLSIDGDLMTDYAYVGKDGGMYTEGRLKAKGVVTVKDGKLYDVTSDAVDSEGNIRIGQAIYSITGTNGTQYKRLYRSRSPLPDDDRPVLATRITYTTEMHSEPNESSEVLCVADQGCSTWITNETQGAWVKVIYTDTDGKLGTGSFVKEGWVKKECFDTTVGMCRYIATSTGLNEPKYDVTYSSNRMDVKRTKYGCRNQTVHQFLGYTLRTLSDIEREKALNNGKDVCDTGSLRIDVWGANVYSEKECNTKIAHLEGGSGFHVLEERPDGSAMKIRYPKGGKDITGWIKESDIVFDQISQKKYKTVKVEKWGKDGKYWKVKDTGKYYGDYYLKYNYDYSGEKGDRVRKLNKYYYATNGGNGMKRFTSLKKAKKFADGSLDNVTIVVGSKNGTATEISLSCLAKSYKAATDAVGIVDEQAAKIMFNEVNALRKKNGKSALPWNEDVYKFMLPGMLYDANFSASVGSAHEYAKGLGFVTGGYLLKDVKMESAENSHPFNQYGAANRSASFRAKRAKEAIKLWSSKSAKAHRDTMLNSKWKCCVCFFIQDSSGHTNARLVSISENELCDAIKDNQKCLDTVKWNEITDETLKQYAQEQISSCADDSVFEYVDVPTD